MSVYSNNLWAEEMGIDLDLLQTERFSHPYQLRMHNKLSNQAALYWANENYLRLLGETAQAIEEYNESEECVKEKDKRAEPARKTAKARKLKVYEFTDQHLQIAMRSLDAGDSV